MITIAAALGVSRPHLSSRQRTARRRRGRPSLPLAWLFAAIGYRSHREFIALSKRIGPVRGLRYNKLSRRLNDLRGVI